MPIELRCPGCGKMYRLADDRAGKQAKCPCGAVMKVPAGGSRDAPTWEDEVNRVFGPSPGSEPKEPEPGAHAHVSVGMDNSHGHEDVVMPPCPPRQADAHGHEDVAMPPRPRSSSVAGIAKFDFVMPLLAGIQPYGDNVAVAAPHGGKQTIIRGDSQVLHAPLVLVRPPPRNASAPRPSVQIIPCQGGPAGRFIQPFSFAQLLVGPFHCVSC
jgi:ribosomal protein S27E